MKYRAHGRGDEGPNLTSPCDELDHMDGEHGGRVKIRGEAPDDIVWLHGRTPVLEVRGREKVLLA